MKVRLPLYGKIVGMLLLNVLVLALVCYAVLRHQFGSGLGTALGRLAADRIQLVAEDLHQKLDAASADERAVILKQIGAAYDMQVSLMRPPNQILVGSDLQLPAAVREEMRSMAGGPRRGAAPPRPPPPREPFFGEEGPLGELFKLEDERPAGGRMPARMGTFMVSAPEDAWRHWVGVVLPPLSGIDRNGGPMFLVFASSSITGHGLFFDTRPWLWGIFGAMALSILLWLPLVRGITGSIRETMQATRQFARGRFDARVNDTRQDELGELGRSVNQMAEQLDGYVRGQKRFMGDVAHELCSPIARMEMGLGILESRVAESAQPRLEEVRTELRELSVMVGELLTFSKASLAGDAKPLETVALVEVVRQAANREGLDADELSGPIPAGLKVYARADQLKRAVANVLRNALIHAPESSSIEVEVERQGDKVLLTIADHGPGVPEESVARLFEPFYRVDAARTRETGGTGLGLAIVKTCVEACGGTVQAKNRQGGGLEVQMELAAAE